MSEGVRCSCEASVHEGARRPSTLPSWIVAALAEPGLCNRYAANQAVGAFCSSCATGWCQPCAGVSPTSTVNDQCGTCGWWASQHR